MPFAERVHVEYHAAPPYTLECTSSGPIGMCYRDTSGCPYKPFWTPPNALDWNNCVPSEGKACLAACKPGFVGNPGVPVSFCQRGKWTAIQVGGPYLCSQLIFAAATHMLQLIDALTNQVLALSGHDIIESLVNHKQGTYGLSLSVAILAPDCAYLWQCLSMAVVAVVGRNTLMSPLSKNNQYVKFRNQRQRYSTCVRLLANTSSLARAGYVELLSVMRPCSHTRHTNISQ
jgi:hypothetical protein